MLWACSVYRHICCEETSEKSTKRPEFQWNIVPIYVMVMAMVVKSGSVYKLVTAYRCSISVARWKDYRALATKGSRVEPQMSRVFHLDHSIWISRLWPKPVGNRPAVAMFTLENKMQIKRLIHRTNIKDNWWQWWHWWWHACSRAIVTWKAEL